MFFVLRVIIGPPLRRLEAFQQPALLRNIRDIHDLGADTAAVSILEPLQNITQRCLRRTVQGSGVKDCAKITFAKAIEGRIQFGNHRPRDQLDGIHFSDTAALKPVRGDQLQYRKLFLKASRKRRRRSTAFLGQGSESILHFYMRNVARAIVELLQLIEITAPARLYRLRIGKIRFVQRLYERRVGAV